MPLEPEVEAHGILAELDTWHVAAAVAAVALAVMLLFVLKLWVDLDNVVDARAQEARVANETQVAACFAGAAQSPALRAVLVAVEREFMDPRATEALRNFIQLNLLNSPTIRDCRQLATDLDVPVLKGAGG